jgi:hypothetical protein
MEEILYITQDLFNKLMGLTCYLEEHSSYLLDLIKGLNFEEAENNSKKEKYFKTLSSIYLRSLKIKEELISLTRDQNNIIKCDNTFKDIFRNLGDNLIHLSTIYEEFVNPNYVIDTSGILRELNN